jgi:hypothetical protein
LVEVFKTLQNSNLILRYKFPASRVSITNNAFLNSLSRSSSLLDKNMNSDLVDIYGIDSQVKSVMEKVRLIGAERNLSKIAAILFATASPFTDDGAAPADLVPKIKSVMNELARTLRGSQKTLASRLDSFKQKYVKSEVRNPLPIEVRILYSCPSCRMIFTELVRSQCDVCGARVDKYKSTIPVQLLDSTIRTYIEKNVWLEDAVARAMRRANFRDVIAGAAFDGRSGVQHEVDVLGTFGRKVLVCECTTSSGGFEKISNLLRIKTDLAAHRGLLVSVGDVPKDVEMFAKTYGMCAIANVLENTKALDEVLAEIRAEFQS